MYELRSYLPKAKKILSEIIKKYSFEIYVMDDYEIRLSNSNCIIKMTVGRYYLDFILEFINPKDPSHTGITECQLEEQKGLITEKMLSDEELKKIKSITDDVEASLYRVSYVLKYYSEYLEGNFN